MTEHVNDHFQTFFSEKRVHDSILMENPIPPNDDQLQMVHDFIMPLMSKNETAVELSLKKVQQKVVNVMGPFARVWKAPEDVKNDPTLTLSLEEVATNMNYVAFGVGISSSNLPPLVQCSVLSHERSSKTERHFEGESRFAFRGTPDVVWR